MTPLFSSADTSLKDGLFHEFKKYGKVTSVQIHGASEDRYGLVFFRQLEDQEKALSVSKGKLFFGMVIEVTAWNGPGKYHIALFVLVADFFFLTWVKFSKLVGDGEVDLPEFYLYVRNVKSSFSPQKPSLKMTSGLWTGGLMSSTQRLRGHFLLETLRRTQVTNNSLKSFSGLEKLL